MADKRISQLVERVSILNNDVLPIVASGAATTNKVTIQTIEDYLQNNLDFGVTSVGLTINTSGTDIAVTGSPIISTGTFTISIPTASATNRGALSSADWTTFNNKVGTTRSINTTAPLQGGGDLSADRTLSITQAGASTNGYLSSTDWNTFNNKQDALGYTPVNQTRQLTINGTSYDLSADRTWNVGTVTSVGISMPSAFSVSGSPVTSTGTLTITGAGTASQYIDGTGALQPFPTIIGQARELIREVYNESGATMAKGTVVYIDGGHGNLPTIAKADASGDATSAQTYGVVQDDILDMSNGYIVVVGDLVGLNTQAFAEGTQLYLSGTTAGAYTSTKPYAPIHLVYVGIVTRSHPQLGVIAVKIQNGYEMDEIHDVAAQNPSNNDILQYKTATGLWTKTAGTTTNIAEGTNLYYTDGRARAAISESVTGLDYNSTTGVLSTTTGYGIPTTAKQAEWDAAYNDKINSAAVTGTTTKTLTLTQQDGGTVTASWTDYDTAPVTSVFGRTGAIVATEGDYNLTQLGDVLITTPSTGQVLRYNGSQWVNDTGYVGTVTSVGLSAPTGFSVSGSPVTSSGTLGLSFAAGYSLPTNASQTNWDAAYNDKINSAAVTGTTTKTLTLTQQDGGTITTSWTDINTDAVTSVFGRTGAVVATEGDYNLGQLGDVAITTPTNGQFLKYDGTSWINAAAGTVTSVTLATGTTGTDVGVTGSPITGAGTITLNIPVASATNTGKLSNTDWVEFNSKPYGSGSSNRIAYWNGVNSLAALDTATYPSLTELSYVKGVTSSIQTQLNNITGNYVTTNTNQDITARKTFRGDTGASLNFNNTANTFVGAISTYKDWFSGGTSTDLAIGAVANLYLFSNNGSNWAMKLDLNRDATFATKVKIDGGTSSQFLKANGDLDSTSYVPTSRTLTINGTTFDLTANRTWTIAAGVTSFNTRTGAITLTSADVTTALGYTPLSAESDTLASVTGRGATTSSNVTFNGSVYLSGTYVQFPFTNTDTTEWPYVRFGAADTANGWDEGIIKANSTNGVFGRYGMGIHTHSSRAFGIYSSGWTKIIGFKSDEVRSYVNFTTTGALTITGTGLDSPRFYMTGPNYTIVEMGDRTSGNSEVGYIKLRSNATTTHDFSANNGELNYINNGGRFAIGDTSANGILHVKGSHVGGYGLINMLSSDACILALDSTASNDIRVRYKYNGSDKWFVGMRTDDNYEIRTGADALRFQLTQGGNATLNNGGLSANQYLAAGTFLRHSEGVLPVTEYAGIIVSPDDYPSCTEKARIYTIGTVNGGGSYRSYIEIEVFGSHRGYTPAGYVEYKKWIVWVGDRISSNLISSAGSDNSVGLWNGTNQYGLRGVYGDDVSTGWVLRLIVNPNCGAGKNYTVKVKYSDLNMTHGPFSYTNHSVYSLDMPRSPHHTQWVSTDGRQDSVVHNGNMYIPTGTLEVIARSSDTSAAVFKHPSNDYTIRSRASNNRDWAWYHSGDNFIFREPGVRTYMAFQHDNGKITMGDTDSQWDTQLRIHGNTGSAGYNTSDMNNVVHISRNNHAYLLFSSPDGYDQGIHFYNTSDASFVGRIAYQHNGSSDKLLFSVNGSIRTEINASGTLTASGDVVAYGSPSDARLKTIKEKVPNALDKVLKLNGYRFDWNETNELTKIKEDVGVIAQEVAEVLPELARTNEDGFMSVRYQGLTAVLIEAIKEQQKQIEELKNLVNALTK